MFLKRKIAIVIGVVIIIPTMFIAVRGVPTLINQVDAVSSSANTSENSRKFMDAAVFLIGGEDAEQAKYVNNVYILEDSRSQDIKAPTSLVELKNDGNCVISKIITAYDINRKMTVRTTWSYYFLNLSKDIYSQKLLNPNTGNSFGYNVTFAGHKAVCVKAVSLNGDAQGPECLENIERRATDPAGVERAIKAGRYIMENFCKPIPQPY